MEDNGIIKLASVEKYFEEDNRRREIQQKLILLREEENALEKELDKLNRDRYKNPTKAVTENMFWADESFSSVAKIDKVYSDAWLGYTCTSRGMIDEKFSTSSIGVLMSYPVPITKEKYDELRKKIIETKAANEYSKKKKKK